MLISSFLGLRNQIKLQIQCQLVRFIAIEYIVIKYTFSELKIRNFQIPQKLLMLKFAIFTKFTSEIGLRILP